MNGLHYNFTCIQILKAYFIHYIPLFAALFHILNFLYVLSQYLKNDLAKYMIANDCSFILYFYYACFNTNKYILNY